MLTARDMIGEEWYHYPGEVETMTELARALPPSPLIVNIGTGFGTSSLTFYEARPDALIFSVDIAPCDKAMENWLKAGVRPGRIMPVRGASANIGRYWRWPVDLCFVDGSHTPEGVEADILHWQHHVKPGGFLVFHDYGNAITPHVKTVVDRCMAEHEPYLGRGYIIAFRMGE